MTHDDGCCPLCGQEWVKAQGQPIVIGNLSLHAGEVRKGNVSLVLAPARFAMLRVLAERAGKPITTNTLMTRLYGDSDDPPSEKLLQVYVSQLRQLVGYNAIETRWGGVYVFHPDKVALNPDANEVPAPNPRTKNKARIIAMFGKGMSDREIAEQMGISHVAVWKRRQRFIKAQSA